MTKQQRLVLVVSVMASVVSAIDGFIVNVALPAISRDLGGGLAVQQWTVDGYLLTLGALILIAGSLSDLFGRRRILALGLVWFGLASLLCALAPNGASLVVARALQGVDAASGQGKIDRSAALGFGLTRIRPALEEANRESALGQHES